MRAGMQLSGRARSVQQRTPSRPQDNQSVEEAGGELTWDFMTDWNEASCRAGWPQTYNLMVYIFSIDCMAGTGQQCCLTELLTENLISYFDLKSYLQIFIKS